MRDKSKIQNLQNGPHGKVNDKLDLLSKESQGKGALPSDVNVAGTKRPEGVLPSTKLPGMAGLKKGIYISSSGDR